MTDLDQYKTYRETGTQLNSDILDAYSDREFIVGTAEELGIEFDGMNLAYEFEPQMAIHFWIPVSTWFPTTSTSKRATGRTRKRAR